MQKGPTATASRTGPFGCSSDMLSSAKRLAKPGPELRGVEPGPVRKPGDRGIPPGPAASATCRATADMDTEQKQPSAQKPRWRRGPVMGKPKVRGSDEPTWKILAAKTPRR